MLDWNPHQYLKFTNERTQPSIDLAARIKIENPKSIIDIGCGPGNSTQVIRERWPNAKLVGLDSSANMIQKAKKDFPDIEWIIGNHLLSRPRFSYRTHRMVQGDRDENLFRKTAG